MTDAAAQNSQPATRAAAPARPATSGAPSVVDSAALGQRLICDVLEPMKHKFVGKDEIIDLLGVCMVAGENLFLLGPPGTAKSALVSELGRNIDGRTFEYLLTRFTEPNEIFGPFDIRKLREGDLVTNTEGMLPEASLVFLDELLNANSAILNSLLMVLNERIFRRGRETRELPLLMVVGASNNLPEDEALQALFDRFLLRVRCENVPEDRLTEVLQAGWSLAVSPRQSTSSVTIDDIWQLHTQLAHVNLTDARSQMVELIRRLRQAGIGISDRRAVKLQRLVAASALLCGRTDANVSDLWVFRYIWDNLEQQELLNGIVQETLAGQTDRPQAHPRARGDERPDPESLSRELDAIAREMEQAGQANGEPDKADADENYSLLNNATIARLRDRLGVLAGRCEWVEGATQRSFLKKQIDGLWARLDG